MPQSCVGEDGEAAGLPMGNSEQCFEEAEGKNVSAHLFLSVLGKIKCDNEYKAFGVMLGT